jgi:hypothetical protein
VTRGGGFAQALALEGEAVRVVHEAVEDGICDGGITEDLRMPPFLIGWCLR